MNKTYRIGIDARLYEETGVGRYIRSLVSYLAKIDAKNHYVLFLRKKNFDSIKLPGKNFSKVLADIRWHTPLEQVVMPYLFLRQKLDLVHFPYQNFAPCFLYPNKFVMTVHDVTIAKVQTGRIANFPYPLPELKQYFFSFFLKLAVKRASSVITVSETSKRDLIKLSSVASDRIKVIYESGELSTEEGIPEMLPNLGKYFLYVGSAHPHKNIPFLIQAFIRTGLKGVKLILVGDDDFFYPQLKKLIQTYHWGDKIFFAGYASDEALVQYYRKATALVFPTLAEGFGLPAIEAMANNCLVLASDIASLREICSDAALYFDPKNSHELSDLLCRVAVHPEKFKENVRRGYERTIHFSWRTLARETLTVYENSLRLRPSE